MLSNDNNIYQNELELINYERNKANDHVSNEHVDTILNGKFQQYLQNNINVDIVQLLMNYNEDGLNKLIDSKDIIGQLEIMILGVSSLLAFIQENWTGPISNEYDCLNQIELDDKTVSKQLSVNSMEISTAIRFPKLLLLAKFILSAKFPHLSTSKWWLFRSLYIHQVLLDETSSYMYDQIETIVKELTETVLVDESQLSELFKIELFHVYLHYKMITKCNQLINKINQTSNMNIELKGALGKRTKWQQKQVAQMLLNVHINNKDDNMEINEDSELNTNEEQHSSTVNEDMQKKDLLDDGDKSFNQIPKEKDSIHERSTSIDNVIQIKTTQKCHEKQYPMNIKLDDEDRLDSIQYTEDIRIPELNSKQQIIVYSNLLYRYKSQPKDKLKNEELLPYIHVLIGQTECLWNIRYGSLFLRSKLESEERRTVERCMMQLEELRNSLNQSKPSIHSRIVHFFSTCIPNGIDVECYLADVFISLGDIKSALLIFEKYYKWEEMIMCYNLLQLRHLSVEIIKKQLEIEQTPKLYCLLGDATDDIQHYHKAWDLSQQKSSRAMKSLGLHYFRSKNYKKSIEYFQKSLEINSIQIELWSRLGFAALEVQDYTVCCSAYNRYVTFEPEDFQGWNNLAKAYLERGEKVRAYNALIEAVKVSNMDNWKVIENLMRVSIDVGDFESAIRNYNYILDIKQKHYDSDVLSIISKAIISNIVDINNRSSRYLLSKCLKLFGRLTSNILNEYKLWYLYAQLNEVSETKDELNLRKTHKYLTHSYKCIMRDENNIKMVNMRKEIHHIVQFLFNTTMELCKTNANLMDKKQLMYSLKMNLKSTLVGLEKNPVQDGEEEVVEEIRELLEQVETILKEES